MIFECTAIILIILVLSIMILRSGNKSGWGIAVLPLTLVPAGYIASSWAVSPLSKMLNLGKPVTWLAFALIILAITCLLIGLIAYQIKKSRARFAYLIVCGGFSVILACVLIVRTIL